MAFTSEFTGSASRGIARVGACTTGRTGRPIASSGVSPPSGGRATMRPLHSPAFLRRPHSCALSFALAAFLAACATSGAGSPDTFAPDESAGAGPQRGSSNEIARAEILNDAAVFTTAYDVVRRLRPGWLMARGRPSFIDPNAGDPLVYVDEVQYGLLDSLYRIPANDILRMVFIGAADATTRWGLGHADGVISIVTVRGG